MENKKITTIGECLIDWVCLDKTTDLYEATTFIKAQGGAPANVAVGLAKLNYPVKFVGGFARDLFGTWLKESLSSHHVDISMSVDIPNSNTRNAYILTDKNGNRVIKTFSVFSCADSMIELKHIDFDDIANSPLIYMGSLLQASEASRFTVSNIINAIETDNIIVYDPNLRLCLWKSTEEAIKTITETFYMVDVVKLSADEIELITGIDKLEVAAQKVYNDYNLKLLVITSGHKGSYYINKQGSGFVKPFKVESVETTGAGDAFVAGLLSGLFDLIVKDQQKCSGLKSLIANLSSETLEKILLKANALGALTTTKPGATSALPTREELESFLQNQS